MTENEILDAMIKRLHDKGWIQWVIWEEEFIAPPDLILGTSGTFMRGIKGRACLQGTAELCSAGSLHTHSAIADRLAATIAHLFPERVHDKVHWNAVVEFNDDPRTTFEDVLLVVKTAREMDGFDCGRSSTLPSRIFY